MGNGRHRCRSRRRQQNVNFAKAVMMAGGVGGETLIFQEHGGEGLSTVLQY